ncbi:PE family protein [Mycobacterium tuberculosis]|uniref:PE family protein n=1 Tax=Mycobacterium tuberculosis TaxID=1773 RepID=UPI0039C85B85
MRVVRSRRSQMSFVIAVPEALTMAASDLANIGSTINAANALDCEPQHRCERYRQQRQRESNWRERGSRPRRWRRRGWRRRRAGRAGGVARRQRRHRR